MLVIFSSMRKIWIIFAKEYLYNLREDMNTYIEALNMKIYILGILIVNVENKKFDDILQKLQDCKQLILQAKSSCVLNKIDLSSIKSIKNKISQIHINTSLVIVKFRSISHMYKQSMADISDSEYLLYKSAQNIYSPSTGLSFTAVVSKSKNLMSKIIKPKVRG